VLRHGEVRRAKLYYLREKVGKRARIRERRQAVGGEGAAAVHGAVAGAGVADTGVISDAELDDDEVVTAPGAEAAAGDSEAEPGNV